MYSRKHKLIVGFIVAVLLVLSLAFASNVPASGETTTKQVSAAEQARYDRDLATYNKAMLAYAQTKTKYDEAKKKYDKKVKQRKAHKNYIKKQTKAINKYLKGSPLAGQGKHFVKAAIKYKTDPRISAAIATKESSKGENCFRPRNAWGMMGMSFSSWKQGIYANNKLLRKLGARPNVTLRVADKYCPPTYRQWYSFVKREMGKMKRYKYVPNTKLPKKPVPPVAPIPPVAPVPSVVTTATP